MENNEENSEKKEPKTLEVQSTAHSVVTYPATIWFSAEFADDWLDDAINEALVGKDRNSRRREIIFSVCFVESYLVEWLRKEVFINIEIITHYSLIKQKKNIFKEVFKDIEIILQYAPIYQRVGITEKLKNVLKDLYSKNLIPKEPDFKQIYWDEMIKLVKFRDGLIHAVASLPDSGSSSNKNKPIPSPKELSSLSPGWAAKTAINLVKKLHEFAGTSPPEWVIENEKKLSK